MIAETTGSLLRDILVYESRLSVLIENEKKNSSRAVSDAEEESARIIGHAEESVKEYRGRSVSETEKEVTRITENIAAECARRVQSTESAFRKSSAAFVRETVDRILGHVE